MVKLNTHMKIRRKNKDNNGWMKLLPMAGCDLYLIPFFLIYCIKKHKKYINIYFLKAIFKSKIGKIYLGRLTKQYLENYVCILKYKNKNHNSSLKNLLYIKSQ